MRHYREFIFHSITVIQAAVANSPSARRPQRLFWTSPRCLLPSIEIHRRRTGAKRTHRHSQGNLQCTTTHLYKFAVVLRLYLILPPPPRSLPPTAPSSTICQPTLTSHPSLPRIIATIFILSTSSFDLLHHLLINLNLLILLLTPSSHSTYSPSNS